MSCAVIRVSALRRFSSQSRGTADLPVLKIPVADLSSVVKKKIAKSPKGSLARSAN